MDTISNFTVHMTTDAMPVVRTYTEVPNCVVINLNGRIGPNSQISLHFQNWDQINELANELRRAADNLEPYYWALSR